jgi:hypothetical protein
MNTSFKLAAVAATTLVCAVSLAGCAAPMSADAKSTARQREELYKYEDRDVTLVGHARMVDTERYRGAVVALADGTEVRIPELKSWPKFTRGDEITIRGRLHRYTPTGTRGADPGEWFALEAVRWQQGDLAKER